MKESEENNNYEDKQFLFGLKIISAYISGVVITIPLLLIFIGLTIKSICICCALLLIMHPLFSSNYREFIFLFFLSNNRLILSLLIALGANIDAKDGHGDTSLIFALSIKDIQRVNILIAAGADIEAKNFYGHTPLRLTIGQDNIELIETLIKAGADTEAKDGYGHTVLMMSIYDDNNQKLAEILTKAGADTEAKDIRGYTPLILAVNLGRTESIKTLIKAGADINARDNYGNTALMRAVNQGNTELVKLLVTEGAKKDLGDILGKTALMIAVEKGYQECVDALAPSEVELGKLQPNDTEWLEYRLKESSDFILYKEMYPSLNIALNLMHRAVFCRNYNAVGLLASQGSLNEQLSYTQEEFEALVLYLNGKYINFVQTIYENSIYVERRIQIKLKRHLDTMILNRANNIKEHTLNFIRLNNSRNPIDYLKGVIVQKKLESKPIFNKWEEMLTTDISTMEGVVLVEYLYRALPIDGDTIEIQKPLVQGNFYNKELSIELYRLHAFFLTIEGRNLVDDEYKLLLNSSTLFSVDTSFQKLYNCRIKLAYQYAREQYGEWFKAAYKMFTVSARKKEKSDKDMPRISVEMIDFIFSYLQPYYKKGYMVIKSPADRVYVQSSKYRSVVLKPGEKCMVMITVHEDEKHFSSVNTGRLNPLFTKAG